MKMNLRALSLLCVPCTLLLVSAPAQTPLPATPATPAPAAADVRRDPFERTKSQIDLLLARRITPPAFDPTRFNPFTIGPVGGQVLTTPDEPPPIATSESLLRLLAPRLRVTGYFSREGLSFAVVDGVPRREGDFIIITHQGAPVNLRVKRVDNDRVILGLGDAEYTLRF